MHKQHPNQTDSLKIGPKLTTGPIRSLNVSVGEESPDAESGVVSTAAIRTRAFQMWERAGKPDGNGETFWLDAERELISN